MNTDEPNYLFVYGTLRKAVNNPVKEQIIDDVEWIGEAAIEGILYDIGNYPGAIPATNNEKGIIKGEIIKIRHPEKILKILDNYEGFDPEQSDKSEYCRKQIIAQLANGEEVKAWVYFYNFSVNGKTRIPHTDYLEYLKTKKSE